MPTECVGGVIDTHLCDLCCRPPLVLERPGTRSPDRKPAPVPSAAPQLSAVDLKRKAHTLLVEWATVKDEKETAQSFE